MNSPFKFEICVETPDALDACVNVADRIELCSGLDIGGVTPSLGMMKKAKALGLETHVLIRPCAGGFRMSPADLDVAIADIEAARELGLKGVVIGAEIDGSLDQFALGSMIEAAHGMDVTLHRVIDVVNDPIAAMEIAIDFGVVRILTSGSAPSAVAGIANLKKLFDTADGRIEIMAGAGITSQNISGIIDQTGIASYHASCTVKQPLQQQYAAYGFGNAERVFDITEAKQISAHLRHGA